jgi:hypothetical protein
VNIPQTNLDLPSFGVEIRDSSLAGAGLADGDVVWIDPRRTAKSGDLVLARIHASRRWRLRVCRLLVGPCGQPYLTAEPASGRAPLVAATPAFEVIGPVRCAVSHLRVPATRRPGAMNPQSTLPEPLLRRLSANSPDGPFSLQKR